MMPSIGERNEAQRGCRRPRALVAVSVATLCLLVGARSALAAGAEPAGERPVGDDTAIPHEAEITPIDLEVVPFVAPSMVRSQFAPFEARLTEVLDRPVKIVVLKSHRAVIDRAGVFDSRLVIAPRHLAAYLAGRRSYAAISYFDNETHPVVYVRAGLEGDSIEMLRGRRLSLPAPLSFHAVMGLGLLRERGLLPGRDFEVRYHTFHDSALFDVVEQRSDAVVTAPAILRLLTPDLQGAVRAIAKLPEPAGAVLLAGPTLDPALRSRLEDVYRAAPSSPTRAPADAAASVGPSAGRPAAPLRPVFLAIPASESESWPALAGLVESTLASFAAREEASPESPEHPSNGG